MDHQKKLVGGPQNVLRLIDPKKQIIYLYIGSTLDATEQLACPEIMSRTIKDYLRDQIRSTDPSKLSFAFPVTQTFLDDVREEKVGLASAYMGTVLRMLMFEFGLEIAPVELNDLVPGLRLSEIENLYFDPHRVDVFRENTSPAIVKMLEDQLELVGTLMEMMKNEIVPPTMLALMERIEPIRSSPLFPVCTDLLHAVRRSLTDLIGLVQRASEMVAGDGRRYFMDIIGEAFLTELPLPYLSQISRDLTILHYKLVSRWNDYLGLLSSLCYLEGIGSDNETTRCIYVYSWIANNILEILIKHKSYRVTHVAYAATDEESPEEMGVDKLNSYLAQIPVEEYNLLLVAQNSFDDLAPGLNNRPSQCVDLAGFPEGFQ